MKQAASGIKNELTNLRIDAGNNVVGLNALQFLGDLWCVRPIAT